MLKIIHILILIKKSHDKDPKFQVGHIVRTSKYIFLKSMLHRIKDILQIDLKNFFWLKKLQILFHGHKLLVILMLNIFVKKELQKTNQVEFRIEKVIKRKATKLYVKWKDYENSFIAGLLKRTLYKMSQYFFKLYEPFGGEINVKVDFSNNATKADLKKATEIDTSSLASKSYLA